MYPNSSGRESRAQMRVDASESFRGEFVQQSDAMQFCDQVVYMLGSGREVVNVSVYL